MTNIYRTVAKTIPHTVRGKIKAFLTYSSIKVDHDSFIGFVTLCSLFVGLIAGFFLSFFLNKPFWWFFVGFTIFTNGVSYLLIMLQVDRKAKFVEEVLPDALQLMSSSLRAGMAPDKALLLSARPEFGPLKTEIDLVGRQVALGKDIGTALLEMAARVKSKRLVRAVELINSGLDSGGTLASLLEATSNDLREQFLIDKKIKASITMYMIFIFSAASVVTPVLFGLSTFLVEVLQATLSSVDLEGSAVSSLPISIGSVELSSEYVIFFITVFIIVNSLMASLLLGLISKGRQREGLRYFVIMLFLALPIFFFVRLAVKSMLGGLFGFT